jgi:transposase
MTYWEWPGVLCYARLALVLYPFSICWPFPEAGTGPVGIEACASSHHRARELLALGHNVGLMPPAYVKLPSCC